MCEQEVNKMEKRKKGTCLHVLVLSELIFFKKFKQLQSIHLFFFRLRVLQTDMIPIISILKKQVPWAKQVEASTGKSGPQKGQIFQETNKKLGN